MEAAHITAEPVTLPTVTTKPSLVARFAQRFGVDPQKMLTTLKATAFKQPVDKQTGEIIEVTNEEMMALLVVADQYGLNPFTKEIYAFRDRKRGGIVPIVGVDGWARIINEHPQFDGMEFSFTVDTDRKLESCECTIYRKDRAHPLKVREFLRECRRDTDAWNGMPSRMMRHRAMIQCARVAFGFVGIYDEEEGRTIIEGSVTSSAPANETLDDLNAEVRAASNGKKATPAPQEPTQAHIDGIAPPTYAEVLDALTKGHKARDSDAFALARDQIRGVADEKQRAELDVEARRMAKDLPA